MNQTQKNYILSRLDSIVMAKNTAIRKQYTIAAVVLTYEERQQALKEGTFTLKDKNTNISPFYNIKAYLTFDDEQDKQVDQKTIDKEINSLAKEQVKTAGQITDKLWETIDELKKEIQEMKSAKQ